MQDRMHGWKSSCPDFAQAAIIEVACLLRQQSRYGISYALLIEVSLRFGSLSRLSVKQGM